MLIGKKWIVAAVAALLFLLTTAAAFAARPKKPGASEKPVEATAPTDPASDQTPAPVSELGLTLEPIEPGPQFREPEAGAQSPELLGTAAEAAMDGSPSSIGEKIRGLAVRYVGTPYRWGGTSPNAFDCSGFTQYVYKRMGVRIPRTARQQYATGKPVKSGNWRVGDLVFFDMRKGYVSHVGMYLSQFSFIHASTPRTGVRIDSLKQRSYKKCYVGARRYCRA